MRILVVGGHSLMFTEAAQAIVECVFDALGLELDWSNGYTTLIPKLLENGCKVRYYDQFFFGIDNDSLPSNNPNLEIINADPRDSSSFSNACKGMDVVLWLSHVDSINYRELAYAESSVKKVMDIYALEQLSLQAIKNATLASSASSLSILSGSERQPMITSDYDAYLVASRFCPIFALASINGYSPRTRLSMTELRDTNGNAEPKPLIRRGFLL